MMDERVAAFVRYYACEGWHGQLQAVVNEVIKRAPSADLVFWRGYGLLAAGATSDAVRELQALLATPDVGLAAAAALLTAHQGARFVDAGAVSVLSARLETEEPSVVGRTALLLAAYLLCTHHYERARALLERALQHASSAGADSALRRSMISLLGHTMLRQHAADVDAGLAEPGELNAALELFQGVLLDQPDDLESLLGSAVALEALGKRHAAWQLLLEAIARLPWAAPLMLELARLTLCQQDWDSLADVVTRLRSVDAHNVMASAYDALMAQLVQGNAADATRHVSDMCTGLQAAEPRAGVLMLQLAAPFARLAGGDARILNITLRMVEHVVQLDPGCAAAIAEAAAQRLALGQAAVALQGYEEALSLDPLHVPAALGIVEAQIAAGRLEDAAQQLEFLPELLATTMSSSAGVANGGFKAKFGFPGRCYRGSKRTLPMAGDARHGHAGTSPDGLHLVAGGLSVEERVHASEPLLLYLRGRLSWARGDVDAGVADLLRYTQLVLDSVEDEPYGLGMLTMLDPGRLLRIVRELLDTAGGDPRTPADPPSPLLSGCIRCLEALGRYIGSHPEAKLQAARAAYLNGALEAAGRAAADLLRVSPECSSAALLVASVHSRAGRHDAALAALEVAVVTDFSIRDTPLYWLVHAQALASSGRLAEARQALEAALLLPGVRTKATAEQAARLGARGALPSVHERASAFLLLVDVLRREGKEGIQTTQEVGRLLAEAVREFIGTPEEARVMVADCEAAVARGDVNSALARLQRVPKDSKHYTHARIALADIHLRHRRDRAAYVRCYLDLVENAPQDCNVHCRLAEAFMAIQEPSKAVSAYETALSLRPKDADLALAAAQAAAAAHDYNCAIDHYNRAIRNDPGKMVLQHGLANLYLRLGNEQAATVLLEKCLEVHKGQSTASSIALEALALDVNTCVERGRAIRDNTLQNASWLLLAKLRALSGSDEAFVCAQQQALALQHNLLERLRNAGAVAAGSSLGAAAGDGLLADFAGGANTYTVATAMDLQGAKTRAAAICFDLAEHHRLRHQLDKAEAAYAECVSLADKHGPARLALARLALAAGRVEDCQAHAATLLSEQPDSEDAAIMLAELNDYQGNIDSAVHYLQQLLERRPQNYAVLVQLMGLLRRSGRLHEAMRFIDAAAAVNNNHTTSSAQNGSTCSSNNSGGKGSNAVAVVQSTPSHGSNACHQPSGSGGDGGLLYCRGLLARYEGCPDDALRRLNAARRDPSWSTAALLAMVEVYLDQDANVDWAVNVAGGGPSDVGATEAVAVADGETLEAVRAANMLLTQLRPADMQATRYKVLRAYAYMASAVRADVEVALGQLLELVGEDPNCVPVLLALSRAFLLLRQPAKARNQLKRIAKLPYRAEEGEEFERAWLTLADMHVVAGKFDLAQDLCTRVLKRNKSCARAWELMGSIAEREAAHQDAAAAYERAWGLAGGHTDGKNEQDGGTGSLASGCCGLGYKLAFNHLKAGRLTDAISVAQAVLRADPGFPRISADVLERARALLRP